LSVPLLFTFYPTLASSPNSLLTYYISLCPNFKPVADGTRFDITPKGQQIHISSNSPVPNEPTASRHPCFKLESVEKLNELRERIWAHYEKGGDGKPMAADKPGDIDSGM
jgi:hypothetical protein